MLLICKSNHLKQNKTFRSPGSRYRERVMITCLSIESTHDVRAGARRWRSPLPRLMSHDDVVRTKLVCDGTRSLVEGYRLSVCHRPRPVIKLQLQLLTYLDCAPEGRADTPHH